MTITCWCGNTELINFSQDYLQCTKCHTLISCQIPSYHINRITDDNLDFYSKKYWFSHQESMGMPNLLSRARSDLPERCIYWMNTLLNYKLPSSRVLEVGCAHGGFVALLQWAGFDATGLELSPWVVDFAGKAFSIPVLLGPLEDQDIEKNSLDVIILMDVIEHLPDPVTVIARCLSLLKQNGILLIQTPCVPENRTYEQMMEAESSFISHLNNDEHFHLFSKQGIKEFFKKLGVADIAFEEAIFSHYDMFFVVSKRPLITHTPEERAEALTATPGGRLILAMLDLQDACYSLHSKLKESEADRAARLEVIKKQAKDFSEKLNEVESDRAARLDAINSLQQKYEESEKDRAARLEVIKKQAKDFSEKLNEIESDRTAQLDMIKSLQDKLQHAEIVFEENILIKNSLSWRLTAPLRWINKVLRQMGNGK